jgi:hypothetical protein
MGRKPAKDLDALFKKDDLRERFWKWVQVKGPDECWPWLGWRQYRKPRGSYSKPGWGAGPKKDRKHLVPSRVAYWLAHNEPLPVDLLVLHNCNNPLCCNPAHMRLGTHRDNMDDMIKAGSQKGERNVNSKLTAAQVETIRHQRAHGMTLKALGDLYGVSLSMIDLICRGVSWPHVGGPIQENRHGATLRVKKYYGGCLGPPLDFGPVE